MRARIVAATNRRLSEAIEAGTFRNDLYYRLQVVEIDVPPLRERPQDLEILVNGFLRELNAQLGLRTEPIDAGLLETLQRYPWPGNVRELRRPRVRRPVSLPGTWCGALASGALRRACSWRRALRSFG